MKKVLTIVIICLTFNLVEGQNWAPLGNGINFEPRILFPDNISGKLFVGGNFWIVDGHSDFAITAWNGASWDTSYSMGFACEHIVTGITRFQNELYTIGGFTYSYNDNKIIDGFSKWNGSSWDSLNTSFHYDYTSWCIKGSPFQFYEYNNLLYCIGMFDSVGSVYSPNIVAWDGTNWIPIHLPQNMISLSIDRCVIFHNELYLSGNFRDSTQNYGYCLIKYDGNNWSFVGLGFWGLIHAMVVYNNELYIGGNNFSGGPADYLVKFDGTNFSSVGSEFAGNVWNLRVIENKLFAVGYIDTADGNIIHDNIAVWDGNHWSDFSNDTLDNAILDVAVYNNELYVVGSFSMINSDSIGGVAKYQGWYLGGNDLKKKKEAVEVYPIPASSSISIHHTQASTSSYEFGITDVYGRVVYKETLTSPETKIDVSKWSTGVYFYELKGEKETARGKFIVQH